ncbi:cytochrome P450 [Aspergillus cavernicola]|uniref:Cytochrome P450 n=1 Tax=Aspergillus cavernicola TaxID=176166 RepID=A0ABR4HS98_9EURO
MDFCAWSEHWIILLGATVAIFIGIRLFPKRANVPVFSRHSGWRGPWKDSLDYLHDSAGTLRAGYQKFSRHGQFFQVRTPIRWVVVVPPNFVDEIRTAPSTHLSAKESANDAKKFHFHIVKTHLTPNLENKIDEIRDEIQLSFGDEIGNPTDWTPVVMSRAAHRIATRTANRLLVGAPLCQNEEYTDMSIKYTVDVFGGADKLRAWPKFLRSTVTQFVTNVKERQRVARKYLIPYIEARLQQEKDGLDEKPPVDSLQWFMDAAPDPSERDPERLMFRLLHLNVAAVHTTSITYLNAMLDLAFYTDVHAELRIEIETAVQEHGWSGRALSQMWKLDSFLTESQRLSPIASSQMTRAAIQDFTFSDGTTVPKGSYVLAPMYAMYLDDRIYPDASTFDAFRFSKLRAQPGHENRHQFVTTSPTHINFGHGKDACPGRFFAAHEIKLLLAHALLSYEIRLEDPTKLPEPSWYDRSRKPNQTARVLFRRR